MNIDLKKDQFLTREKMISELNDLNYNSTLFCGVEGNVETCSKCKKYSKCYDQHCVINDKQYYVDYFLEKSKIGFDSFVMIDDDFWHALLRPQKLINNPESKIDSLVSQIYFRDSVFNDHCVKNKISLIRFSSQDVSLFMMHRIDKVVPYFFSVKSKAKKFFSILGSSIDLFTKNVFGEKNER